MWPGGSWSPMVTKTKALVLTGFGPCERIHIIFGWVLFLCFFVCVLKKKSVMLCTLKKGCYSILTETSLYLSSTSLGLPKMSFLVL